MSNHGKIFIPDHEYKERVARAAKILQREKLDAMIVNSNEADYANARYFVKDNAAALAQLMEVCIVKRQDNGGAR